MQAIANPPTPSSFLRSAKRSIKQASPAAQNPPARAAVVEYRTGKRSRIFATSALVVLALFDLNCVLWASPCAARIAEWSGVSLIDSIYIGIAAAAVVLILAIITAKSAWRYLCR